MKKYQNFLSEHFYFLLVEFSIYLNRPIFVMLINAVLNFISSFELWYS